MDVYSVDYHFRDGGSKWIVKANNPLAAIEFVKDYFRTELGWQGEGRFGATRICQKEGEVYCTF